MNTDANMYTEIYRNQGGRLDILGDTNYIISLTKVP